MDTRRVTPIDEEAVVGAQDSEESPSSKSLENEEVQSPAPVPEKRRQMSGDERQAAGIKMLVKMRSTLSMAFRAAGMPVTFQAVSYTVKSNSNRGERVTLLKDVSGYLRPGEMSALMGPSGSGKTTLLDVLAGRKTQGKIEGEIRYAGHKPTQAFLRRWAGYVEQQDTLHENLTVEEMLMYTAELKRPVNESFEEKKEAVDELIDRLGLDSCRNVCIGSSLSRGVSGGQVKRTNIGVALVTNPRVLFLDEPTSGLDSHTATAVMSAVRSLTMMGITVAATIHSPTPFTFALFDQLMLLIRGQVVYFGPNGRSPIDYFSSLAKDLPQLRQGENPAEWVVDLTTEADSQGRTTDFVAAYQKSEMFQLAAAQAQMLRDPERFKKGKMGKEIAATKESATPFTFGVKTMFKYRSLKNFRSLKFMAPRAGAPFIFALLLFTLYINKGATLNAANVTNITQLLFIWTLLAGYVSITYIPTIVLERAIYVRERNDGLYSIMTHLTAKMLEEVLVLIFTAIACSAVVFWTVQLQGNFGFFYLQELCTMSTGVALAYLVAAISPNMEVANALLPVYLTMMLLFMGIVILWDSIPRYWRWLGYTNFLRYAWGGAMVNQFSGDWNVLMPNGQSILEYYSLDGVNMWVWLLIEFGFFWIFFLLSYVALRFVHFEKR